MFKTLYPSGINSFFFNNKVKRWRTGPIIKTFEKTKSYNLHLTCEYKVTWFQHDGCSTHKIDRKIFSDHINSNTSGQVDLLIWHCMLFSYQVKSNKPYWPINIDGLQFWERFVVIFSVFRNILCLVFITVFII